MKFSELFDTWGLKSLHLNWKFLEAEFAPTDGDREAAWELYVYLVTTILTQRLPNEDGDEKTALDSVYGLFKETRRILVEKGRHASNFTKIAVIVLNQKVRPFTARWHKRSLAGAFSQPDQCRVFREELAVLQSTMRHYAAMLADIAKVEDITEIEDD